MQNDVSIIFPHQLFKKSEIVDNKQTVYLVEEFLFFNQYKFHKQKIAFHRATMKFYENFLLEIGHKVFYIDAQNELSDIRKLLVNLKKEEITSINIADVTDNWLEKRITTTSNSENLKINWLESPLFLNSKSDLNTFFKSSKKKFYQTSFYKQQRSLRNILMENNQPEGGKWTYDSENRKKYPKEKIPPSITFPEENQFTKESVEYVENHYKNNYGSITKTFNYPTTHKEAEKWLNQFFEQRFNDFGVYEDAIVADENILNHSVISPLINVGLLNPNYVINQAISYAKKNDIPINSTEGFVRQIMGWREFIRGIYEVKGIEERTSNFWNVHHKIPNSFYDGTTGILPVDITIKKVLKTSYAHHIERLMILGNFMVLCEFHPNEVYRWFMELFIDAYDWVMVPNIYGMSLYADGGLMSTKPYISSSNYILKMSDYKNGSWCDIWDGLFWRFMNKHRDFFLKNPRLSMLIRTFDKMSNEKRQNHIQNAELFLKSLHS